MHRFWDHILQPITAALAPRVIVEIGCSDGACTQRLLAYAVSARATVHTIDPEPRIEYPSWSERWGSSLILHRTFSLNALSHIDAMDFVLIDGDHNWFTVKSELDLIYRNSVGQGRPFPLVALGHVGWPYARRDSYCDPDRIPDAFRYPHRRWGLLPSEREPVQGHGLYADRFNSLYETDLRSGVLSAVEDFRAEHDGLFEFSMTPALSGLGLLGQTENARIKAALAQFRTLVGADGGAQALVATIEGARLDALVQSAERAHEVATAEVAQARLETRIREQESDLAAAHGEIRELQGIVARQATELTAAQARWLKADERLRSSRQKELTDPARISAPANGMTEPTDGRQNSKAPKTSESTTTPVIAASSPDSATKAQRSPSPLRLVRSALRVLYWTATGQLERRLVERREAAETARVQEEQRGIIRRSGLFDAQWYLARYPDVARANVDPLQHFVVHGRKDKRDPNPNFATAWYLETYPEVANSGLNPVIDYVQGGAEAGRNPNPEFDSLGYLRANADVAEAGMNPLSHYIRFGRSEGRRAEPVHSAFTNAPAALTIAVPAPLAMHSVESAATSRPLLAAGAPTLPAVPRRLNLHQRISADVIVAIHNSTEDVARCLCALAVHRREHDRIILVDDASGEETRDLIDRFAAQNPTDVVIRNEEQLGYTRTINRGIAASQAAYVVLLNSDTVVTADWLAKLIDAGESNERIGIVGPLSNAASWQSVPERFRSDGDWKINELPVGFDADLMGRMVETVSPAPAARQTPLINGFCMAIKRSVLDAVGGFDETNFPRGYGEETDYCFRAADRGFSCAVALDAYVHHAKSRSFTHANRRTLTKAGNDRLREMYSAERIGAAVHAMRQDLSLETARARISELLAALEQGRPPTVVFLSPVHPGGGGVHSIMQEARGLSELGVKASVAVPKNLEPHYRKHYPGPAGDILLTYASDADLIKRGGAFTICVATVNTSIALLEQLCTHNGRTIPCYYAQDYEPLFYAEDDERRAAAISSYAWVKNAIVFAKTNWIREQIEARHDVRVFRVEASLDRALYCPAPQRTPGPVQVAAMVRTSTPRRGAARTVSVLRRLHEAYGSNVELLLFGADASELSEAGLSLPPGARNAGRVVREDAAKLLRDADVFVDFSDYQAFGRTALEAMACGATVVVPREGGADEFARHMHNAVVVDTTNENACFEATRQLIDDASLRARLREAGLQTAARYSVPKAARSELILFRALLASATSPAPSAAAQANAS